MDHLQRHLYRNPVELGNLPSQVWPGNFSTTTADQTRPLVARHYLRHWEANKTPRADAPPIADGAVRPRLAGAVDEARVSERPAAFAAPRKLVAGHAVTLRASELMVLRIAHGRVWVTLTDVGPWSRVLAGDHFLTRSDSLTLLPGQELVMESFSADPASTAQFTWQAPGICATAQEPAPAVDLRASLHEPWLDLRHAVGLALGAAGRLVHGLGQVGGAALAPLLTPFATILGASGAHHQKAGDTFDALNGDSGAPCRL